MNRAEQLSSPERRWANRTNRSNVSHFGRLLPLCDRRDFIDTFSYHETILPQTTLNSVTYGRFDIIFIFCRFWLTIALLVNKHGPSVRFQKMGFFEPVKKLFL